MSSRRTVLATASSALAATLAGCNVLESGGSGEGSSDPQRWLTQEVARIPYEDAPPVGESPEIPLLKQFTNGRPMRAQSVDSLSDYAMERVTSHGNIAHSTSQGGLEQTPIPADETAEITRLFGGEVSLALGEFDAPEPPENATKAGSHRGTSLYHQSLDISPRFNGVAIDDGTYVRVSGQPSAEDATAALQTLLDAEAGEGTPIEADGNVDRIWSFLEQGFYRSYYAGSEQRGGISLRADGGTVHRRAIMLQTSESDAKELATFTEEKVANSSTGDGERAPWDYGPYDDVTVNRDGSAVTVEGSLPASAVGSPEFSTP